MISALHQRFPTTFTPLLTASLAKALQPFPKTYLASLTPEQREKEEVGRISKQRIYLRISVELWLVGVLRNVEDGVSSLNSSGLDDVDTQRDGVAGLVSSSSSSSTSLEKKKQRKDDKENNKPAGFVYRVLRDLVS